jgi:aspartyl-tRNA(Asn)/glutamyl-tRNA(Gln) amidotransferase subunit B
VRRALPELPDARRRRFEAEYQLPHYDAAILTTSRELADYFEACLHHFNQPKVVSNWVMGPLLGLLNAQDRPIEATPVAAADLAALLRLVDRGLISGKIAKTVFAEMAATGRPPAEIVQAKGLGQVSDAGAIEQAVDRVLAACPDEVARCKAGQAKLMGFFVGQVMKATQGKANPKIVNEMLTRKLK